MTTTHNISNMDDLIDIRDVIERVEDLEGEHGNESACDECIELAELSQLLESFAGYGGDEQWRGEWYPIMLIRDSYFEDYAQELADDIGAIDSNASWPLNCIDWEQAASELQYDYTAAEFDGVTYWAR